MDGVLGVVRRTKFDELGSLVQSQRGPATVIALGRPQEPLFRLAGMGRRVGPQ